jgi:diguanylate cyclase (GGDEF)-like protein/PAS domain S-box-containing protein
MAPEAALVHSLGDDRLFEGLTQSILDAALDCIVVVGTDGRVVAWNAAAEQTFGYSSEEAIGSEVAELIVPPELREGHRRGLARHLATGAERMLGRRLELEAVRADGSRLPVELAITRLDRQPPLFVGYLRDISQRLHSADAVEEAERRYRTLVERLPVVTYSAELGPAGRWTYVSPQIEHMTGYTAEEWMADPELWFRRLHPSDREKVVRAEAKVEREGGRLEIEYRLLGRHGDVVWVRDEATSTPARDGCSGLVEGVLVDITEQRRAAESLRYHADHDVLTGLVNRRRFEEELERCGSGGSHGAVVIVDVDHFKFVNDSLGHEAGDAVLRGVASSLRERVGATGLPARLGGDEFAVLLPGAGEQEARELAVSLLHAVRSRETRVPVTASAGISVFDAGPTQDPGDALVAADIALYEAKEDGRDRVATFTGQQGQRLTWVGRIRRAIEEQRLVLHSQPIVDLATGETAGEELLVRMLDDSGELVMPSAFLPTAERFGLIRDIDRWVVSRALELTAAGRRVSVNLSARSVSDPELTSRVEQSLRLAGADPSLLVFEITETAAAADMEDVREFAERVQRLGCGLALDDFGTGFGSFIYLKHLPVRELKIDMEFVRHVSHSQADRRLVQSIVMIARAMGVRTVAEGVEDAATLAVLREYGVDRAQGWHLGAPAPVVPA